MERWTYSPGDRVFDLYAGVGLFSRFLAQSAARVTAVESSPWANSDFQVNLAAWEDVVLHRSTVEAALSQMAEKPKAVLVDPPRRGLGRRVIEALRILSPPRLVYVSCDPATLARDGKRLAKIGYHLERITPIDLFPQTFHIETISLWLR